MHIAYQLGVTEGLAAQFRGEGLGEIFEVAEAGADVDGGVWRGLGGGGGVLVEEDGEEGLGATGVLDDLGGEEEGGGS